MKKIQTQLFILFTIFFATFASAQTNFNFKKDHDALLVKDLNVAANFYKDIMGLQEIPNGGLGEHIRWFQLNDRIQIHLIQSDDQIITHKGVHMAMNTNRLDEFMESLKSRNIHFENWTAEKGTTNVRPDHVRQIYFQDPDGYWIEVNDGSLE